MIWSTKLLIKRQKEKYISVFDEKNEKMLLFSHQKLLNLQRLYRIVFPLLNRSDIDKMNEKTN